MGFAVLMLMKSSNPYKCIALASIVAVAMAAPVFGQSASTDTGTATPRPPEPERAISAKASAAITSSFKYTPPPPPKPEVDEEMDLRDVDRPKNEIVRLPKYTVTAKKPEVFTDRQLYTQEELKKLAMARYLKPLDRNLLNRWTIPGLGMSNEQRAMDQYLADERLQNMANMQQDILILKETGQSERADQTQADYYNMFLRQRDDIHTETLTRQQGR